MTATPGSLRFRGSKRKLDLRLIEHVSLTGLYWPSLVGLAWGMGLTLLAASAGFFTFLTLDNPLTYFALLAIALFALAAWPLWWVHVEYRDEGGKIAHAYFADGSLLTKHIMAGHTTDRPQIAVPLESGAE